MARKVRRKRASAVFSVIVALVCALSLSIPGAFAADPGLTPGTTPAIGDATWTASTAPVATKNADGQAYVTSVASKTVDSFADMLGVSAVTWSGGAASGIKWTVGDAAANLTMLQNNAFAGIFATDTNVNPNPWGKNLIYNQYAQVNNLEPIADYRQYTMIYPTRQDSPGPNGADTKVIDEYGTSRALAMRPDIIIGPKGQGADNPYAASVAEINGWTASSPYYQVGDESYSPQYVAWTSSSMHAHAQVMYGIAKAAEATIAKSTVDGKATKATRYDESAMDIAKKYEKYMLASQYYVLSQINSGAIKKKTVGFVRQVDDDTQTIRFLANGANNAGTNFRGVEALMYTTNNIVDVLQKSADQEGTSADGKSTYSYYAGTAADVLACDVIVIQTDNTDGGAGDGVTAEQWTQKLKQVLDATGQDYKMPDVFVNTPKAALALSRGAADCAMNYGIYLGYVYPEAINPVHMLAYFYENFYHVQSSELAHVAGILAPQMSMPKDVSLEDVATYSSDAVEQKLDAGLQYYARNKSAIDALSEDGDLTPFPEFGEIEICELNTAALDQLIGQAKALNASTPEGTDPTAVEKGEFIVSAEAKAALTAAVQEAEAAKANALLQQDIDSATDELQAAVDEFNAAKIRTAPAPVDANQMYRLYNKYTGEHFYTANGTERDNLVKQGWTLEGIGWNAPKTSKTPVYRLYNPYAPGGDHHYTTSTSERDNLVKAGWQAEGTGWYSDDAKGVPLLRQYNPYAQVGTHNYTTSQSENDKLVSLGWVAEGEAWYGVK